MKISRIFSATLLLSFVSFCSSNIVSAKDEWVKVRSKNFQLVGNAAEKDIRRVAARLEQFRETFRQILTKVKHDSPVPVNIVVFKDEKSFRNFKPLNEEGQHKDWVKGYFQSGEDANYIVLSVEGERTDAYRTIFHEYIHFLVNNDIGLANVPPWFNEGLAEYYETFQIEEDRKVTLGSVNNELLFALRQNKLIEFETFFNTDNYTLRRQGADGAGLFYAQSWALIHYLMHSNGGARSGQLDKYTALVLSGKTSKESFTEAFQTDYAAMERELKKYIEQKTFRASVTILKNKLTVDDAVQSSSISESEAKAVLGDLLYHTNRLPEAAAMLEEVLKLDADSSLANTSLGLVKLRQGKFAEAEKYLGKAIALDDKNYLAHYQYAYALSREQMTVYGFVSGYTAGQTAKMRESLEKAIALNPNFPESYHLLAFINIVRNEQIEEASEYLDKALKLAPGNQWYLMRTAEIYLKKEDFATARQIAQKVYETAPDDRLRVYAKNTVNTVNSLEAQLASIKNNRPPAATAVTDKILTEEEFAELNKKALREAINQNLRRLRTNEKRVLGTLSHVECGATGIVYTIKIDDKNLKLTSADFQSLVLVGYGVNPDNTQIGCEPLKKEVFAVITYRPKADAKSGTTGELVAIELVPKDFVLSN